MFDVRIATPSNIIDKIRKLQTKMAAKEIAMVVILSELADSDDEKPTRGPTRSWIKRRKENGFFETIIWELILEDLAGFKEMFRMGYADFEKILSSIVVLISPQEIIDGHRPICAEEKLALTLRFLATGESFSSLSFQFRISKSAVAYIVKRVCESIVKCLLHIYMSYQVLKMSGCRGLKSLNSVGTIHMSWVLRWKARRYTATQKRWLLLLQLQTYAFNHLNGNCRSKLRMYLC